MPVNFPPDKVQFQAEFKGTGLEQVQAARDGLINYNQLIDEIFLSDPKATPTAAAGKKERSNGFTIVGEEILSGGRLPDRGRLRRGRQTTGPA